MLKKKKEKKRKCNKNHSKVWYPREFIFIFLKEEILQVIKCLPSNKASPFDNILIKILKNSIHIYSEKLTNIFNEYLINEKFPNTLKRADVTRI